MLSDSTIRPAFRKGAKALLRCCFLLAIVLVISSANAEDYAGRWVRLANEHVALVKVEPGKSYEARFVEGHNTFWREISAKCEDKAVEAGLEKFSAILVIDKAGVVKEFLTAPHTPRLSCYVEEMVGRRYPAPPSAPFYEMLIVRLKKNSG
jgi:hypothetical protein